MCLGLFTTDFDGLWQEDSLDSYKIRFFQGNELTPSNAAFFPFFQKVFQVLPSILVPEREHWLAPDLSILQGQQHK